MGTCRRESSSLSGGTGQRVRYRSRFLGVRGGGGQDSIKMAIGDHLAAKEECKWLERPGLAARPHLKEETDTVSFIMCREENRTWHEIERLVEGPPMATSVPGAHQAVSLSLEPGHEDQKKGSRTESESAGRVGAAEESVSRRRHARKNSVPWRASAAIPIRTSR